MTTTLRPTGPEPRAPDGARSRAYDILANGRPVGHLRVATDPGHGPSAGRLEELRVVPDERRVGRAATAALAAEEVLRGWGCDRVGVAVPEEAGAALNLAWALGYRERNRNMLKELSAPAELPPERGELRPMGEREFADWRTAEQRSLLDELLSWGVPRDRAERKARDSHRLHLPDGLGTGWAALRVLSSGGTDVGTLWLAWADSVAPGGRVPRADADSWVFAVRVAAEHRGRGHGRALMLAAERECVAAGATVLGLNVYTGNTPALRLYQSLGYRTVERYLHKSLP